MIICLHAEQLYRALFNVCVITALPVCDTTITPVFNNNKAAVGFHATGIFKWLQHGLNIKPGSFHIAAKLNCARRAQPLTCFWSKTLASFPLNERRLKCKFLWLCSPHRGVSSGAGTPPVSPGSERLIRRREKKSALSTARHNEVDAKKKNVSPPRSERRTDGEKEAGVRLAAEMLAATTFARLQHRLDTQQNNRFERKKNQREGKMVREELGDRERGRQRERECTFAFVY